MKLSEDKSTDWNTSFETLGVLFEIDQTGSGVLKVRINKSRKLLKFVLEIQQISAYCDSHHKRNTLA